MEKSKEKPTENLMENSTEPTKPPDATRTTKSANAIKAENAFQEHGANLAKPEKQGDEQKEDKGVEQAPDSLVAELKELKENYENLRIVKDEMESLAKRQKAEFDNYRKRVQEEKIDLMKYGGEDFFKSFLSIMDAFEKALDLETENEQVLSFLKGFVILKKQIDELLLKQGVRSSSAVDDEFNPSFHKAIQFKEGDGEEDKIVEIFQKGYFFHDKVLREAMVKIAKKKEMEPNKEHKKKDN